MPLDERFWARFWSKVEKTDTCWLWTASTAKQGYGQVNVDGRPQLTHRLVLEQAEGRPLEPGEMACHHCDVKRCVRPDHLYRGNARTNARDAVARGQHVAPPRKTHCIKGHPLSTWRYRQICWTCHRDALRRARAKRKGRAA